MDRSATDPLVGQVLDGRYRVGAKIARGGMATVYEATDLRLDRAVAIKVMPHALADNDEFSQRFVREARAAARLTHPNVVAVYDQGDDDGVLFLAMEYVAGRQTLRDLIRAEAPMSPTRALTLLEEILKAIAAAHESGIIHRDVKPENVLIDPRGRIKVADFGLARAISSATTATATGGVLMGTVSYMAPELVTEGRSDARSDVYALGVLLFELLTGKKPHTGDSPIQIAYKHVHDDVPPASTVVDGIPSYLDAFIARATARHRDLRPADAHVMLQQLRRVRHALDHGVVDDQELTDDLTPTIAVPRAPLAMSGAIPLAVPGADLDFDILAFESPAPAASGPDEVFDVAAYDDFTAPTAAGPPGVRPGPDFLSPYEDNRTLVAPRTRQSGSTGDHDTLESLDGGRAEAAPAPSRSLPPGPSAAGGPVVVRRRRRRKGGLIAFILVLLLALGAGVAGWYYGVGRYRATPEVIAVSHSAAAASMADAGLTLVVSRAAYSESVPEGHVVSTDPGSGDDVLRGGTVEAVVSKGQERHDVPDLADLSESEAITALRDDSLDVDVRERVWSEMDARGEVVRFTPEAGTELKRDAVVTLVVSKGPRPIRIADSTGEQADSAESGLSDAGFEVTPVERYDDDVAAGVVIRQLPARGIGHQGDPIRLVVSLGPHLVEVPDVDSFGVDDARVTLEEAGFDVEVDQFQPYFGLEYVVGQSPDAGSMAPYGSTLRIVVV